MITSVKDLRFYINEDTKRNRDSKYPLSLSYICGSESARVVSYLKTLRKLEYFTNVTSDGVGGMYHKLACWYYRIRLHQKSVKYGIWIYPNMVGYGLKILHIGGIHINCFAMGNYCEITQGVVVGNKGGDNERAVIGNNVQLTLGCKVIGKVMIGDNVVVAPNSVVIKDIPANCIVSGVPAVIIKRK